MSVGTNDGPGSTRPGGCRMTRRAGAGAGAIGLATTIALATAGPALNASAAGPAGSSASGTSDVSTAAWPSPSERVRVSSTIDLPKDFDGGLKEYYGVGDGSQNENQPPMFNVPDGGVVKNVIVGPPAGDGIHCLGSCTLQNVWWTDVGEDAASFKGTNPSVQITISGGGAKAAADKVFNFDSGGNAVIENFQVEDFGKLIRSCGNCEHQFKRTIALRNITATAPGKALVGVNTNYGDQATLSGITIIGDAQKKIAICTRYHDNGAGVEPTEQGADADGTFCSYSPSAVTYK